MKLIFHLTIKVIAIQCAQFEVMNYNCQKYQMNPINFVFIYNYVYHKKVDLNSSEKRDLCLMKLSSKTLQILTYR